MPDFFKRLGTGVWYSRILPPTVSVEQRYSNLNVILGHGTSGPVRLCQNIMTGTVYARKTLRFGDFPNSTLLSFYTEIEANLHFDHPNIARLIEVYTTPEHIDIILEYCRGGNMIKTIQGGPLGQSAQFYFRQMMDAVAYIHELGYVNRDLKLDNFVMDIEDADPDYRNPMPKWTVKLIDFGFTRKIYETPTGLAVPMTSMKGTAQYVAPEILTGLYHQSADMWSMGVILCVLLFGRYPFGEAKNEGEFLLLLKKQQPITFAKEEISAAGVSPEAMDLLHKLLEYDPEKRIKARDVLNHPFVRPDVECCVGTRGVQVTMSRSGLSNLLRLCPGLEDKNEPKVITSMEEVMRAIHRTLALNPIIRAVVLLATFYIPERVQRLWEPIFLSYATHGFIDLSKYSPHFKYSPHSEILNGSNSAGGWLSEPREGGPYMSFTVFLSTVFMQGNFETLGFNPIDALNQAITNMKSLTYFLELCPEKNQYLPDSGMKDCLPNLDFNPKNRQPDEFYRLNEKNCLSAFGENVFGQSTSVEFAKIGRITPTCSVPVISTIRLVEIISDYQNAKTSKINEILGVPTEVNIPWGDPLAPKAPDVS